MEDGDYKTAVEAAMMSINLLHLSDEEEGDGDDDDKNNNYEKGAVGMCSNDNRQTDFVIEDPMITCRRAHELDKDNFEKIISTVNANNDTLEWLRRAAPNHLAIYRRLEQIGVFTKQFLKLVIAEPVMAHESTRLASFDSYNNPGCNGLAVGEGNSFYYATKNFYRYEFAATGLYYCKEENSLKCFFCGLKLPYDKYTITAFLLHDNHG